MVRITLKKSPTKYELIKIKVSISLFVLVEEISGNKNATQQTICKEDTIKKA